MKSKIDEQLDHRKHKNEDNWVGIFYVNSEDTRILVPRKNKMMGWTFNFGNRFTYVLILFVVLVIVAYQMYM